MNNQLCPHCKETTPELIGKDRSSYIFWCPTCGTLQAEHWKKEIIPTATQNLFQPNK